MASTERFGYEWNKYSKIIPEYEGQFLKWVYPLKQSDFSGTSVLDAGCGIGRNSFWPLKYGAKHVLGFDFDRRTVAVAKRNLATFKNAEVRFQSIYDIDYEDHFDIAFSIGVIHHLENPHLAIKNLVKAVKKGGTVLIWVYGYENNEWIVQYINPIRQLTSKLPLRLTSFISFLLALPFCLYLKLLPQKHPYLKQLSKFRFWHVRSIVFDQLIPRIANYWKMEQALGLFKNKGLRDVQIYRVNNNSWTLIGRKA
ncbi:class I SAM-dependent methyltransferase [Candidatus Woesearchaeota archaeon]|nr:class I SAM-dependent methyltransferase [Candidatus Woesearchaeota archaeon]MBW3021708.1 class I SAM-dependent methyltransferase [Candidatus Woesearchaeota archaeon]